MLRKHVQPSAGSNSLEVFHAQNELTTIKPIGVWFPPVVTLLVNLYNTCQKLSFFFQRLMRLVLVNHAKYSAELLPHPPVAASKASSRVVESRVAELASWDGQSPAATMP